MASQKQNCIFHYDEFAKIVTMFLNENRVYVFRLFLDFKPSAHTSYVKKHKSIIQNLIVRIIEISREI